MSSTEAPSRLLSPREAADVLGLSLSGLAKMRCLTSNGPRFVRLGGGRRIGYDPADLADYIEANKHRSTSEYTATPAPAPVEASAP